MIILLEKVAPVPHLPIIFNGYLQYVDIIQGVKTSHDFVELPMQF